MRLNVTPAGGLTGVVPRSVYRDVSPPGEGSCSDRAMADASDVQRGHVDPAPLFPALQSGFDQLHAFRALRQVPAIRLVLDHVPDEMFPLDLEAVVVDLRVRH